MLASENRLYLTNKNFIKKPSQLLFLLLKTAKKLNKKIISLIKAINIEIKAFLSKTKLYTRFIPRFDKNYKNA